VQLVLQGVLYFLFQLLWHVVSVGNISDSGHWHSAHKLISETWQLRFQEPNNVAIANP